MTLDFGPFVGSPNGSYNLEVYINSLNKKAQELPDIYINELTLNRQRLQHLENWTGADEDRKVITAPAIARIREATEILEKIVANEQVPSVNKQESVLYATSQ